MRFLEDFNFKGKRALVRCDFNVALDEKGKVLDDFRIEKTIPTIECLIKKGAKVILMSHLGRPKGKVVKELSLSPVQEKLLEYLDLSVTKAKDCIGREIEKWTKEMQQGEILLLENLRFHKGETDNDLDFAKELAKLGDIFINDAFSVSHRAHASIVSIPKFLPSGIGLLFKEEIEALSKILKNPKRPLVGIIGGAKVATKIKPIRKFLERVDFLLLGGKIADVILRVKGISVGKPLPEPEIMEEIKALELTDLKLRLPVDVIAALNEVCVRSSGLGSVRKDELILDIGPETVKIFSQIIRGAKTIFWSGPLGKIEEKRFTMGTLGIARAIPQKAFSVAGGRETVSFLQEYNLTKNFSYLSPAGGAMLEYLGEGSLPGVKALEESK